MEQKPLLDTAKENLIIYGKKVIEDRAIPAIEDGLKPVQRRILWASLSLGLDKTLKKSARIVGDVMGKYHPHGDMSIYDALVKMTKFNVPLMDGSHSNFGDFESPPAAQRYTETKLTRFSDLVLLDRDYLKVTPMIQNYDGEFKEPFYLPSLLPIHIINGIEGIAFGCSVLMIPFSLRSVIDLVIESFKKPKLKLINNKFLSKFLNHDSISFPYGGECQTLDEDFDDLFITGKASLKFRPKITSKQIAQRGSSKRIITISSLAPRLKIEKILQTIASDKSITNIVNKTSGGELKIEITMEGDINDYQRIISKMTSSLTTQYIYLLRSLILPPASQNVSTSREEDEHVTDDDNIIISMPFKETGLRESFIDWLKFRLKLEKAHLNQKLYELQIQKAKQQLLLFLIENRKTFIQILDSHNPKEKTKQILKRKRLFDYDKIMAIDDCVDYILNTRILSISRANKDKILESIKSIDNDIDKTQNYLENPRQSVVDKTISLAEKLEKEGVI